MHLMFCICECDFHHMYRHCKHVSICTGTKVTLYKLHVDLKFSKPCKPLEASSGLHLCLINAFWITFPNTFH